MTANELRKIRKRLGWSQPQLAEVVGVTANSVARWERGEMRIIEPAARLILIIAGQHTPKKEEKRTKARKGHLFAVVCAHCGTVKRRRWRHDARAWQVSHRALGARHLKTTIQTVKEVHQ